MPCPVICGWLNSDPKPLRGRAERQRQRLTPVRLNLYGRRMRCKRQKRSPVGINNTELTRPPFTNLRYRLIRSHRLEWYQLIPHPAPRIG